MLMLSGGIDSPVAAWLAMKRGIVVEAVHFHSYPYTSERAKQKVVDLTSVLAQYAGGKMKLHLVPFTDIQIGLRDEARPNLLITLMRRAMFRITERLAEEREALAIVTGENLGQVASQTLSSLNAINKVVSMPVLRPLITMEKEEIIRLAERIGTYELSILPYEDCCTLFVPKNPSTNPNQRTLERTEQRLTWLAERIDAAVRNTESIWIASEERSEADELL
jgi:thiamine biosynthesis protein ThiI